MRFSANASGQAGHTDVDPTQTREWLESLESVINEDGKARALFLLDELEEQLRRKGVRASVQPYSAYRNTIPLDMQGPYPGDLAIEEKITSIVRWNALAMVVRANQAYGELGGHIASYASAAEIFSTSLTPPQAYTRAPSSRDGSTKSAWLIIGRKSPGVGCAPTLIRG